MRRQQLQTCDRCSPRRSSALFTWLSIIICGVASGCEEEPRHVTGPPDRQAKVNTKANVQPIVNRQTQEVRNASTELQTKGAQVTTTKITAKDYITLQGNAYITIIGRRSQLLIDQAMDLFRAANDRFPKDYDEFMAEIIKAGNISLPKLPPHQEYGYDEKEHKLIILEYTARNDQAGQ
jgi:hypothetical protein